MFFSCRKKHDSFLKDLELKINSNLLTIEDKFVQSFQKEINNHYPNKNLVINEIDSKLVASFEDLSYVNVRDRGNFQIIIMDSSYFFNGKTIDLKTEIHYYLKDIKERGFKKVGIFDIAMNEKENYTHQDCRKLVQIIQQIDRSMDIIRDSISNNLYLKKYADLSYDKRKVIDDNYDKTIVLHLFEDIDIFFKPPPGSVPN
jgi:hypothetical protein